jgi:DNA-binding response OmpR family regulator
MSMDYSKKELKLYARDKSILVVDDDIMTTKIINAILSEYFSTIDMAFNLQEAMEKYKNNRYDIVLTDIYMPDGDGLSLIKKIKREKFNQPVIVISSTEDIDKVIELIDYNIDSFIKKPLDINIIVQKINTVLENIFFNTIIKNYQSDKIIKEYLQSQGIACHTINSKSVSNHGVASSTVANRLSAKDFISIISHKEFDVNYIKDELSLELENLEDIISYILVNGTDEESINSLSQIFSKIYNIVSVFDELSELSDVLYEIHDILVEFENNNNQNFSTNDLFAYSQFIIDDMKRFINGVFIHQDSDNIYIYKDLFESILNQLKVKLGINQDDEDDITFF